MRTPGGEVDGGAFEHLAGEVAAGFLGEGAAVFLLELFFGHGQAFVVEEVFWDAGTVFGFDGEAFPVVFAALLAVLFKDAVEEALLAVGGGEEPGFAAGDGEGWSDGGVDGIIDARGFVDDE